MKYEIWSKGNNEVYPIYHGVGHGKTFDNACINYFTSNDPSGLFNKEQLTFWGNKLFQAKIIEPLLDRLFNMGELN